MPRIHAGRPKGRPAVNRWIYIRTGQHGTQYVVMPRYSERSPRVVAPTVVGIVNS